MAANILTSISPTKSRDQKLKDTFPKEFFNKPTSLKYNLQKRNGAADFFFINRWYLSNYKKSGEKYLRVLTGDAQKRNPRSDSTLVHKSVITLYSVPHPRGIFKK